MMTELPLLDRLDTPAPAARNFATTRQQALAQLAGFVPRAGRHYAAGRNTDQGPDQGPDQGGAVSFLSPAVRYRLIAEREVVTAVLARHSAAAAEKFVQEVLWRTYWKGWLEMRPDVWTRFVQQRDQQRAAHADCAVLADAEAGRTGIEGFDDWARELTATGYLHNHARMWFASIWIFTLRLPWELGADFFLRHLLDGDAASNTLSWRWVAGLQTAGKTYLARSDNIARYTNGRFAPAGLAAEAPALEEPPVPAARPLPACAAYDPSRPALLLVTPDDLSPENVLPAGAPIAAAMVADDPTLLWGDKARRHVSTGAQDALQRAASHFGCDALLCPQLNAQALIAAARGAGLSQIVTPYAPVGLVADRLAALAPVLDAEGITLAQIRRQWDTAFWPHANRGFFPFKEKIPATLRKLGLA